MADQYAEFLKDLHSKSIITDDLVSDVIYEAVGKRPIKKERILAGEVNEVYDVILQGGDHVITRFHKADHPVFDQEKWAIDQCKKIGVPAPTVLAIKHVQQGDKILSVCIQEKLPGDTLERGALDYNKVPEATRKTILHKAGEVLAKIHTIPVRGFGDLNEKGEGEEDTFLKIMIRPPKKEKEYMALAIKLGIEQSMMQKAFQILRDHAPAYADTIPVFNHGDFAPKHFMYIGDKITGILDFGDVLSHAPIYDFARWEFFYGNDKNFEWLKEGYGDPSLFKGSDELSRLIRLYMGLGVVHWYSDVVYAEGVEFGKKAIADLIASFQ
jgi:aminoglycoside phosphotransferase (APT) family kinase protein